MPSLSHLAHIISNGVHRVSGAATGSEASGNDAAFGQEAGAEGGNLAQKLAVFVAAALIGSVLIRRAYHALQARGYFGSQDRADDGSPAPTPRADSPSIDVRALSGENTLRMRGSVGEAARAAEVAADHAPRVVSPVAARVASPFPPVAEVRVVINGDSSPERQDSPAVENPAARAASPSASSSGSASPSSGRRSPDLELGGSWVHFTRADASSPISSFASSESESSRSTSPLLGGSRSATPSSPSR